MADIVRWEPQSAWLVFAAGEMGRVSFDGPLTRICTAPGEVLELGGAGGTGIDQSDAWVFFDLDGAGLAAIVPVDLDPAGFGIGSAAATVAAHISVLLWRRAGGFTFGCRRSYADSFAAVLASV